jgi:hypothetical protein
MVSYGEVEELLGLERDRIRKDFLASVDPLPSVIRLSPFWPNRSLSRIPDDILYLMSLYYEKRRKEDGLGSALLITRENPREVPCGRDMESQLGDWIAWKKGVETK